MLLGIVDWRILLEVLLLLVEEVLGKDGSDEEDGDEDGDSLLDGLDDFDVEDIPDIEDISLDDDDL